MTSVAFAAVKESLELPRTSMVNAFCTEAPLLVAKSHEVDNSKALAEYRFRGLEVWIIEDRSDRQMIRKAEAMPHSTSERRHAVLQRGSSCLAVKFEGCLTFPSPRKLRSSGWILQGERP